MKTLILTMVIIMHSPIIGRSSTFDNNMNGLIIGGGIGLGPVYFTEPWNRTEGLFFSQNETSTRVAIQTNIKIGFGFANRNEISIESKLSWLSIEYGFDEYDENKGSAIVAQGIYGIGILHRFRDTAPTNFINAGFGLGSWAGPFDGDHHDLYNGLGFFIGAGNQMMKHTCLQFELMAGSVKWPSTYFTDGDRMVFLQFRVILNGLVY